MRPRRPGPLLLGVATALLGALALGSGALPRLRHAVQAGALSERELGSGTALRLLRRLGVLHPAAGGHPDAACGELLYTTRAVRPRALPSSRAVPRGLLAWGVPVLSIAIEPCRLDRLLENADGRGRAFEEFATVSYFEGRALRFASGVGLRLHGGRSRRDPRKSFRLYFREQYGASAFAPGVVTDPGEAPLRLVVHSDLRFDRERKPWQFLNSLGYDIARRLGGIAPRTKPMWLVLNGEPQHVYVLTEHVSDDFLHRHFGHASFTLMRGGRRNRDPRIQSIYEKEMRWALEQDPLGIPEVEARLDLENLIRWYVTILFCATDDALQSPIARSERPGDDRRWRWIHWDMDLSFRLRFQRLAHGWQKNLFLMAERGGPPRDHFERALLRRLTRERPAFRARLAARLAEALNHELTPAWLEERVRHYEEEAERLRLPVRDFLDDLREFVRRRPRELRRQARAHLRIRATHRVRVRAPGEDWLEVDGHPVGSDWTGTYFEGTKIALRVRERHRATFAYWRVDGRDVANRSPRLVLPIPGPAEVEAVLRTAPPASASGPP